MSDLVHVPSTLPAHASSFELAPAAWGLAQKIAATEFVPKGLRNEPTKVLACMLTGNELGIGPMQALAKIHIIEGKPGAAAELMRALILRDGHEFWIAESTNTKCTVGIKRKGSTREQMFTWTMDDAKAAGLSGKGPWRTYPRAMLLARATSEGARAVCPDSISGLSYTVEELSDGGVYDPDDVATATEPAAAAKPAGRTARASRAATAPAAPALTVVRDQPTLAEVPPLPGEDDKPAVPDIEEIMSGWAKSLSGEAKAEWLRWKQSHPRWHLSDDLRTEAYAVLDALAHPAPADDDDIVDAEVIDDDGPAPRLITDDQRRMLFAALHDADVSDNERHDWASGWLSRTVTTFNDLTVDEASRLIEQALAEAAPIEQE